MKRTLKFLGLFSCLLLSACSQGQASSAVSSSSSPSSSSSSSSSSSESTVTYYTVSFLDYDGTLLYEDTVEEGGTAYYDGDGPYREKTASTLYVFSGWDKDLTNVTSSFSATAQYDEQIRQYFITWKDYDGTILDCSSYDYGSVPSYPNSEPYRPADVNGTYAFTGWDKELATVTEEATYTATYAFTARSVTFKSIATGYHHSLAIDSEGKLYSWGSNDYGQLGNGTRTALKIPTEVVVADKTFKDCETTAWSSLALTTDGDIYAFGANSCYELGLQDNTAFYLKPTKVDAGDVKFSAISSGDYHTIALSTGGKLYAFGQSSNGECGVKAATLKAPTLIETNKDIKIDSIEAGYCNSYFITDEGKLYGMGLNDMGQLGDGTIVNCYAPTLITINDEKVLEVSCGSCGTNYFLTASNKYIYGAGNNFNYELTCDPATTPSSATPIIVAASLVGFTAVTGGSGFALALDANGVLCSWGENDYGALGLSTQYRATEATDISMNKVVFTSISSSYFHSLALDENGILYAFGINSSGECGINTTSTINIPVRVN